MLALQTARKEYQWSKMSEHQKKLWGEAAVTGWKAYIDNSAVEVLSLHESSRIRKELSRRGELDRILVPRFVLTDKHDGLRTETNKPLAGQGILEAGGSWVQGQDQS